MLKIKLRKYQRTGVKKLLPLRRSLLCDPPGVGKTPQAIACIDKWRPQHIVVIAPSSLLFMWEEKIKAWLTDPPSTFVFDAATAKIITKFLSLPDPKPQVIITSYDLAVKPTVMPILINHLLPPDSLLICDEAHKLRNYSAKRTRTIIKKLAPLPYRAIYVTGTPIYKHVQDLYPLLLATNRIKDTTLFKFQQTYSYPIDVPYGSGFKFIGKRNIPRLKKLLGPIMVRRKKEDVLPELPGRQLSNIYLKTKTPPTPSKELKAAFKAYSDAIANNEEPKHVPAISTYRSDLANLKTAAGIKFTKDFLTSIPEDEPIVIFAHHKEVIAKIKEALTPFLKKESLPPLAILDGSTSPRERHSLEANFQAGKYKVLLISMTAGGEGITLTKANKCIFFELDWSPAVMGQCIDRLDRFGQEIKVQVYLLLVKDSLDNQIINLISRKTSLTKEILEDG